MEMTIINLTLPVTILYAGLFGVMMVPMTMFVALRRFKTHTSFGDGGDETLTRRMRAHGNFIETVPFALLLIALVELSGGSEGLIHGLGGTLLVGRLLHYFTILRKPIAVTRGLGMVATLGVILGAAVWLLYTYFAG